MVIWDCTLTRLKGSWLHMNRQATLKLYNTIAVNMLNINSWHQLKTIVFKVLMPFYLFTRVILLPSVDHLHPLFGSFSLNFNSLLIKFSLVGASFCKHDCFKFFLGNIILFSPQQSWPLCHKPVIIHLLLISVSVTMTHCHMVIHSCDKFCINVSKGKKSCSPNTQPHQKPYKFDFEVKCQ